MTKNHDEPFIVASKTAASVQPLQRSKHVLGVVLAGGNATRLSGGDKSLRPLGQSTILHQVCQRLQSQLPDILLNTNSDPTLFSAFPYPLINDQPWIDSGPLAGILAACYYARDHGFRQIITVAADTPFFPAHLVSALLAAHKSTGATIIFARSHDQAHPTFALWPAEIADTLETWLTTSKRRSIRAFAQDHSVAYADFDAPDSESGLEPFFNINTPADLARARHACAQMEWQRNEAGQSQ